MWWLFDDAELTPHGFCLLWEPGLLWLQAGSDLVIGGAYFAIPLALLRLLRRRRGASTGALFWLFAIPLVGVLCLPLIVETRP